MLFHLHFLVFPAAGDGHAFGLHDAVVRVGPAAEGVAVGHVAVGIFFHHDRGAGVLGVDGVRLTEFHSLVSRLRHAIGRAGPAVGYLVVLGRKIRGVDGVGLHVFRRKVRLVADLLAFLVRPIDELVAGARGGDRTLAVLARIDGLRRGADLAAAVGLIGDVEHVHLPLGKENGILVDRGNGIALRIGSALSVRLGVPADELVVGLLQPVAAGHGGIILALDQDGAFRLCARAAVGVVADGDQIRRLLVHIDLHHIGIDILFQGAGLPLNGVETAVVGEVIAPHLLGQLSGAVIVLVVVQSGPVDVLILGVEERVAAGLARIQLHGDLIGLRVVPHRVKVHVLSGHGEGIAGLVLRGRGVFVLRPAQELVTGAGQRVLIFHGDGVAFVILKARGGLAVVLADQRVRVIADRMLGLLQDDAVHMEAVGFLFDDMPQNVLGVGVIAHPHALHRSFDLVIGGRFVQVVQDRRAGGVGDELALLHSARDLGDRDVLAVIVRAGLFKDLAVGADEEGGLLTVLPHPDGIQGDIVRRQFVGIAGGIDGLHIVIGAAIVGVGINAPPQEAFFRHGGQSHHIAGLAVHRGGGSAGAAVGGVGVIGKGDLGGDHLDNVFEFLGFFIDESPFVRDSDGNRAHFLAGHRCVITSVAQGHNVPSADHGPIVGYAPRAVDLEAFAHFYGYIFRLVIGAAGQGRGQGLGHIVADGAEGADLQRADARLGGLQGAVRLLVEHDDGLVFARFGQRHGHGDRLFGLHGGALGVHDGDIIDHQSVQGLTLPQQRADLALQGGAVLQGRDLHGGALGQNAFHRVGGAVLSRAGQLDRLLLHRGLLGRSLILGSLLSGSLLSGSLLGGSLFLGGLLRRGLLSRSLLSRGLLSGSLILGSLLSRGLLRRGLLGRGLLGRGLLRRGLLGGGLPHFLFVVQCLRGRFLVSSGADGNGRLRCCDHAVVCKRAQRCCGHDQRHRQQDADGAANFVPKLVHDVLLSELISAFSPRWENKTASHRIAITYTSVAGCHFQAL